MKANELSAARRRALLLGCAVGRSRRQGKSVAAVQPAHFDDQGSLGRIEILDILARPTVVPHGTPGAVLAHHFPQPNYIDDVAADLVQHEIARFPQLDDRNWNFREPELGAAARSVNSVSN